MPISSALKTQWTSGLLKTIILYAHWSGFVILERPLHHARFSDHDLEALTGSHCARPVCRNDPEVAHQTRGTPNLRRKFRTDGRQITVPARTEPVAG